MGWLERWRERRRIAPMVRPWAIAGPVLVLMLAAPLLRPLWAPGVASDREIANLAAVRSVLEFRTLAIPKQLVAGNTSVFSAHGQLFTSDSPAFPILLAGPAWVLQKFGITFDSNPLVLEYLLILFCVTFPTAMACGVIYRMGRAFELRRALRMTIALACVVATGWFSYSTVLLPYAPAAALVMLAAASAVHLVRSEKPMLASGWLMAGSFCAMTAAVIEPSAAWMALLMPALALSLPHPRKVRWTCFALVLLGSAAPFVLHAMVNPAITGDLLPPRWHIDYASDTSPQFVAPLVEESDPLDLTAWVSLGRWLNRFLSLTVGTHGMISHFPVIVLGFAGAWIILHRHWTRTLKWLAGAVIVVLATQLAIASSTRPQSIDLTFAAPQFVVALPVLLVCSGAWLRRPQRAFARTLASIALGVSVLVSLIGATAPAPPEGYLRYTATEAAARLFNPKSGRASTVANSR